MILKSVGAVGTYELIYSLIVSLLRRIPTLYTFFSQASTFAMQILSIIVVVLCVDIIIAVVDLAKTFITWLNSKL
jgi:hypothetical protein